jgi:primosomal protein N'
MYILQVTPIASGLPENYFSYFSKDKILAGTLVEIKIRNRKIFGIISKVTPAKNQKMDLKTQNFILKKIERKIVDSFLPEKMELSINNLSILLGIKESYIFESFIPKFILESPTLFLDHDQEPVIKKSIYKNKAFIFDLKERVNYYREKIKKILTQKKSLVIFFPTINDLENMRKILEKDFVESLVYFHSGQTKKEQEKNIEKLKKENSVLILSTPSLLPFILKDKINLETVIIEKENSHNYFSHSTKKQIDARKIIQNISKDLELEIISAGEIISLETFKNLKKKDIFESEIKKSQEFKIVNMSKDQQKKVDLEKRVKRISEKKDSKYDQVYFSDELVDKLENLKNQNEGKIFLYTKRKGLYTETICQDCNTILKCEDCDKPLILFNKNNGNREYVCTNCKTKKELNKEENLLCKNCGSWRMGTIGVGVEGIEKNLKEIGWKTFVLDSKNANTKKKIKEIINAWQNEKLSILIGTDLALASFASDLKIDLTAIISIDSLFSIPEINIDEKIINLILEIKEKCQTKEKILIETRLPENNIWKYIKENDYKKFLEEEIKTREELSLPPFVNIIKFKLSEKELKLKNDIENLLGRIFKEEKVEKNKIVWWKENVSKSYVGMFMIKKEDFEFEEENIIYPTNLAKKINTLLSDFRLEINPQSVY